MLNDQWQEFMKNGSYKKYQISSNQNKPYCDMFQRYLMEKYQLEYFREHPFEEALNCHHNEFKLIIKSV